MARRPLNVTSITEFALPPWKDHLDDHYHSWFRKATEMGRRKNRAIAGCRKNFVTALCRVLDANSGELDHHDEPVVAGRGTLDLAFLYWYWGDDHRYRAVCSVHFDEKVVKLDGLDRKPWEVPTKPEPLSNLHRPDTQGLGFDIIAFDGSLTNFYVRLDRNKALGADPQATLTIRARTPIPKTPAAESPKLVTSVYSKYKKSPSFPVKELVAELTQLRENMSRRLTLNLEAKSRQGISVDPNVMMDIEDAAKAIDDLNSEIEMLDSL